MPEPSEEEQERRELRDALRRVLAQRGGCCMGHHRPDCPVGHAQAVLARYENDTRPVDTDS